MDNEEEKLDSEHERRDGEEYRLDSEHERRDGRNTGWRASMRDWTGRKKVDSEHDSLTRKSTGWTASMRGWPGKRKAGQPALLTGQRGVQAGQRA